MTYFFPFQDASLDHIHTANALLQTGYYCVTPHCILTFFISLIDIVFNISSRQTAPIKNHQWEIEFVCANHKQHRSIAFHVDTV